MDGRDKSGQTANRLILLPRNHKTGLFLFRAGQLQFVRVGAPNDRPGMVVINIELFMCLLWVVVWYGIVVATLVPRNG